MGHKDNLNRAAFCAHLEAVAMQITLLKDRFQTGRYTYFNLTKNEQERVLIALEHSRGFLTGLNGELRERCPSTPHISLEEANYITTQEVETDREKDRMYESDAAADYEGE